MALSRKRTSSEERAEWKTVGMRGRILAKVRPPYTGAQKALRESYDLTEIAAYSTSAWISAGSIIPKSCRDEMTEPPGRVDRNARFNQ